MTNKPAEIAEERRAALYREVTAHMRDFLRYRATMDYHRSFMDSDDEDSEPDEELLARFQEMSLPELAAHLKSTGSKWYTEYEKYLKRMAKAGQPTE